MMTMTTSSPAKSEDAASLILRAASRLSLTPETKEIKKVLKNLKKERLTQIYQLKLLSQNQWRSMGATIGLIFSIKALLRSESSSQMSRSGTPSGSLSSSREDQRINVSYEWSTDLVDKNEAKETTREVQSVEEKKRLSSNLEKFQSLMNSKVEEEEKSVATFEWMMDHYEGGARVDIFQSLKAFQTNIQAKIPNKSKLNHTDDDKSELSELQTTVRPSIAGDSLDDDYFAMEIRCLAHNVRISQKDIAESCHKFDLILVGVGSSIEPPEHTTRTSRSYFTASVRALQSEKESPRKQNKHKMASKSNVNSMTVKEMKEELKGYGVSARAFIEKQEFVHALLAERLKRDPATSLTQRSQPQRSKSMIFQFATSGPDYDIPLMSRDDSCVLYLSQRSPGSKPITLETEVPPKKKKTKTSKEPTSPIPPIPSVIYVDTVDNTAEETGSAKMKSSSLEFFLSSYSKKSTLEIPEPTTPTSKRPKHRKSVAPKSTGHLKSRKILSSPQLSEPGTKIKANLSYKSSLPPPPLASPKSATPKSTVHVKSRKSLSTCSPQVSEKTKTFKSSLSPPPLASPKSTTSKITSPKSTGHLKSRKSLSSLHVSEKAKSTKSSLPPPPLTAPRTDRASYRKSKSVGKLSVGAENTLKNLPGPPLAKFRKNASSRGFTESSKKKRSLPTASSRKPRKVAPLENNSNKPAVKKNVKGTFTKELKKRGSTRSSRSGGVIG